MRSLITFIVLIVYLVASLPSAQAVTIYDDFLLPNPAEGAPYFPPNSYITQNTLDPGVPGGKRLLLNNAYNGTWSYMYVGNDIVQVDNYGGASSYFIWYGALAGAGNIGDLSAPHLGFEVDLVNSFPTRGQGSLFIDVWDSNTPAGTPVTASIANVATGLHQIPFTSFAGIDFTDITSVRLHLYTFAQPDYSYFIVNHFATYGAIPEPASLSLLALSGLMLLRRR